MAMLLKFIALVALALLSMMSAYAIDAKPTEWLFFGLLTAFAMPFAGALIAAVHIQEE